MGDRNSSNSPQNNARNTADQGKRRGLNEKLAHHIPWPRTNRHAHADFACPLRDANQHDIHDANTTDQQRYARNSSKPNRENLGRGLDGRENIAQIAQGEIIFIAFPQAVPLAQQQFNFRLGLAHVLPFTDFDHDGTNTAVFGPAGANHPLACTLERQKHGIILVLPLRALAFAGHHADHLKRHILDPDRLANGVVRAEKLVLHREAKQRHLSAALVFLAAEHPAAFKIPLARFKESILNAKNAGAPVGAPEHHLSPTPQHGGCDLNSENFLLHGACIIIVQGRGLSGAKAHAALSHIAGKDNNQIGAKRFDATDDFLAGTAANRHGGNNRRHTYDNAQHGQN